MVTEAEVVATRRYAGYGRIALEPVASALVGLSAAEESALRLAFLVPLAAFEAAIAGASESLDTSSAAVWTRNPAELAERTGLYRAQRLALCRFLGIEPGIGIYDPIVVVPAADDGGSTGSGGLASIPFVATV